MSAPSTDNGKGEGGKLSSPSNALIHGERPTDNWWCAAIHQLIKNVVLLCYRSERWLGHYSAGLAEGEQASTPKQYYGRGGQCCFTVLPA